MKYIALAGLAAVAQAATNCASNADCAPEGAGTTCVQGEKGSSTKSKRKNSGAAFCATKDKCDTDDGNKKSTKRLYYYCPFTDENPADNPAPPPFATGGGAPFKAGEEGCDQL